MKQIVTNKSGELKVLEVPAPGISPGQVLVRTHFSLISAGTEGAQIREGKAGLLTKVKDHPEQVQMVLGKLKKEGIKSVASQVREKLKEWKTLGYSLSGVVIGVGEGVTDLKVGDHVGCGGAGYAVHAEIVSVPKNLVVKIPEGVSMRDASFVTLGTIALHGVREAQPTLGEFALVQGLGLVGQLAVQFLKASGARVAATDLSEERMALAKKLGADLVLPANEDAQASIAAWTGGAGVDMVLVCAATQSSGPLDTASKLARDKGRIVVVGDVGMELSRGPFFRKELGFSLSRSYGPGRYDPMYEEGGVDYPLSYVRWTEGRNLGAVLDCLARKELQVDDLVTDEVDLDKAPEAYARILAGGGLGTVIRYPQNEDPTRTIQLASSSGETNSGEVGVLVVGAGYFAKTFHLPNLQASSRMKLVGVVSGTGANARQVAERYQAAFCSTDYEEGLSQPDVDAVILATRHDLHVPQALAAIAKGKHVLMEKPLALTGEDLKKLNQALKANPVRFAVGFNRRYAPMTVQLKSLLANRQGPVQGVYRMNAGRLPRDHWVNDPVEGGGRILGEACHVFDWFTYLLDAQPQTMQSTMLRSADVEVIDEDNLTATVGYDDGSAMTLMYNTAGAKQYPKESCDLFAPGLAATLVDYKELRWVGSSSGNKSSRVEDKGQGEEMKVWREYLVNGDEARVATFSEAALSTWVTLCALEAAKTGETIDIGRTFASLME